MEIKNLSAEPLGKLHSWIPHDLEAEKVVFLPDACPGKSPLPTGTAVLTKQPGWRKFAVSDCGCGMRLLRTDLSQADLTQTRWDRVAERLRKNKGDLGDLGGGNHFLDAIVPDDDGPVHFLVHTGSRSESGLVDDFVDEPDRFDQEFSRVVDWAKENRAAIHRAIEAEFGLCQLVLDLPHNTYEILPDGGAIIRKGSVKVGEGDLNILPSHMSGDVVLTRATAAVSDTLFSLSHGTGRTRSRAESKEISRDFDFGELRKKILMPSDLADASLRTDGPFAYRDLDECLELLDGYLEVITRFRVVAYMGHL